MSFGKMTTFIDIIEVQKIKDSSGFVTNQDVILASVKAYKEMRHGTEKWANRATFSKATALFRFRKIPSVNVTTAHVIVCDTGRYNILSVEDIKNRGMYTECLCDEVYISGSPQNEVLKGKRSNPEANKYLRIANRERRVMRRSG